MCVCEHWLVGVKTKGILFKKAFACGDGGEKAQKQDRDYNTEED